MIKDGKTYTIADNSTKDIAFDKAVDYIAYNDVQTYLDTLAPAGYYDTVLVTCGIREDVRAARWYIMPEKNVL